jgi:hypothetical protein
MQELFEKGHVLASRLSISLLIATQMNASLVSHITPLLPRHGY